MDRNHCAGIAYLEVLISVALIALLLLGINALQLLTLHSTQNLYATAVATQQVSNMREILHASNPPDAAMSSKWVAQNKILLPQGDGSVLGTYPDYKVYVAWGDTKCTDNNVSKIGCLKSEVTV